MSRVTILNLNMNKWGNHILKSNSFQDPTAELKQYIIFKS